MTAFIRQYSEAGDARPFARSMRAGRLVRRRARAPLPTRSRVDVFSGKRLYGPMPMRRRYSGGDPFRFKMPKFVRKLSLKKVVKGVTSLAKKALPIVAPFIPGIGPLVAPLIGGAFAGGGSPEAPAPELIQQPEPTGPPGIVARTGYQQMPYGTLSGDYGPDDEDEDEDEFEDDFEDDFEDTEE